jgi:hypothetical protein
MLVVLELHRLLNCLVVLVPAVLVAVIIKQAPAQEQQLKGLTVALAPAPTQLAAEAVVLVQLVVQLHLLLLALEVQDLLRQLLELQ